jgi:hypothetical protein
VYYDTEFLVCRIDRYFYHISVQHHVEETDDPVGRRTIGRLQTLNELIKKFNHIEPKVRREVSGKKSSNLGSLSAFESKRRCPAGGCTIRAHSGMIERPGYGPG